MHLLLTLALNISWAQSCESMRLDDPGQSMEKMPILNQKDIGDCYANVAAQAIDAYRFSRGDRNYLHRTSAVALALDHKKDLEDQHISKSKPLGYKVEKYADYLDDGLPYRLLREASQSFGGVRSCDTNTIEKLIENKKDIKNLLKTWDEKRRDAITRADTSNAFIKLVALNTYNVNYCRNKTTEFVKAINSSADEADPRNFLVQTVGKICSENSIQIQIPKPERYTSATLTGVGANPDMGNKLKNILSRKDPQPIIGSICTSLLSASTPITNGCKPSHGVIIIGQRKSSDGSGCEFLVRNSWGKKECFLDQCVEPGQKWISEDILTSGLKEITTLSNEVDAAPVKNKALNQTQ